MDQIPAAMDRHLDVLRCHRDGGLLLGASSLTGRYWLGSLWYYENPDHAPDVEKCTAGVQLEAGLRDAQWLDLNKVLVGLDTGGIAIWELQDDFHTFILSQSSLEHDDMVSAVSVSANRHHVVSGSFDKCIKVWDVENLSTINSYAGHSDKIWSVQCHPQESSVFISCSQDGRLLLWDTRKPKPASIVDKKPLICSATCLSWHPENEHIAAIADEIGGVVIKDIRKGVDFVTSYTPHTRFVQRVEFCPTKPSLLASVGEDCRTAVLSLNGTEVTELFNEADHSDFVHGLTWHSSDKLYTCGWDGYVKKVMLSGLKDKQNGEPVVMEVNGEVHEEIGEGVLVDGKKSYSQVMKTSQEVVTEG